MPGSVIVVNGPSSSGKSTLCRAAQRLLPRPFLFHSFDAVLFGDVLPRGADGRLREWETLRPRVVDGFIRSIRAVAEADNDVVVELIIEDRAMAQRLHDQMRGLDVFWVGLHVSIEELERREAERGDRPVGDARRDLEVVHSFRRYDLDLDADRPVEEAAHALVDAWQHRRSVPPDG